MNVQGMNTVIQLCLTLSAALGLMASLTVFRSCYADWAYARVTGEWPSIVQVTGEQTCQEAARVAIHALFLMLGALWLIGLVEIALALPNSGWGVLYYAGVTVVRLLIVGQSCLRWYSRRRVLALERQARRRREPEGSQP